MKPHQERIIVEKTELNQKRVKLLEFIGGETYKSLDRQEQHRLNQQVTVMSLYENILQERIEAFMGQVGNE